MIRCCNLQSLTHRNHSNWKSSAACTDKANRDSNSCWIISVSGERTIPSSVPPLLSSPLLSSPLTASCQAVNKAAQPFLTTPPGESDLLCRLVKMFFCPSYSLLFSLSIPFLLLSVIIISQVSLTHTGTCLSLRALGISIVSNAGLFILIPGVRGAYMWTSGCKHLLAMLCRQSLCLTSPVLFLSLDTAEYPHWTK